MKKTKFFKNILLTSVFVVLTVSLISIYTFQVLAVSPNANANPNANNSNFNSNSPYSSKVLVKALSVTGTTTLATDVGNVGIGNSEPTSLLTVGPTGGFKVNSSGQVIAGTWRGAPIESAYLPQGLTVDNINQIANRSILDTTDILPTSRGGTGQNWSAVVTGGLPYFSGTGTMSTLAAGTPNYLLMAKGNAAPSWTNAINNVSIGATTPSSGAFTNLSVTGNAGIGTGNPITQFQVAGKLPSSASGSVAIGGNGLSVYVQGRYAYVGTMNSGKIKIFDVSNPAAPVLVGSASVNGLYDYVNSVYVQGRYAYAATGNGTIQIFDVSNQASPVSVGSLTIATQAQAIYVQGRYAYIISRYDSTLQIIDISNPATPLKISSLATGQSPMGLYVQGKYAYVGNSNGNTVQVFDVSNPSTPVSVGVSGVNAGNPWSVYVQGRYLYEVDYGQGRLLIYDISNPATPTKVGSANTAGIYPYPYSVYVQGRYAYVVNGNSISGNLQVFDISNPVVPLSVGTVATGSSPRSVFVQGRYAYVVNGNSNTLEVFDLGGAYIQQLETGGIETGTLATRNNLQVGNDLDVRGGVQIGRGLSVAGPFSVFGGNTSSVLSVDQNGLLEVKKIKAEEINTQKIIADKLQLRDQTTGEIYCTWIDNGEWTKVKGECAQ